MSAHQMHDLSVLITERRRYTVVAGGGERIVDWDHMETLDDDGGHVYCHTCAMDVGDVELNEEGTDDVVRFWDDEEEG